MSTEILWKLRSHRTTENRLLVNLIALRSRFKQLTHTWLHISNVEPTVELMRVELTSTTSCFQRVDLSEAVNPACLESYTLTALKSTREPTSALGTNDKGLSVAKILAADKVTMSHR